MALINTRPSNAAQEMRRIRGICAIFKVIDVFDGAVDAFRIGIPTPTQQAFM